MVALRLLNFHRQYQSAVPELCMLFSCCCQRGVRHICSVILPITVPLLRLKPYTDRSCLGSCVIFFAGVVAAFGSTQASFLPKKAILRLDRMSQDSASFALTTRSGVLHRVLWRLLTAHRNSGAFPRWKQSTALRTGSKICCTRYPQIATSPLPRGWFHVVEKDQSPTASGTRKRWRNRPTKSTPNRSLESQLSRADARSNCQLLPYYFTKYPGEELNLSRVHLANYSTTLWIPSYWRTIYRLFRHTPCSR